MDLWKTNIWTWTEAIAGNNFMQPFTQVLRQVLGHTFSYFCNKTSLAVEICKFELALFAQSNASSMQIMRVPTYIIWIAEYFE